MDTVPQSARNAIYGLYCSCPKCAKACPGRVRYVGQTQDTVSSRFSKHKWNARNGSDWAVCRWMRKHGVEHIKYRVLEVLDRVGELDDAELRWIEKLGTLHTKGSGGLNIWPGGKSVRGYKWTDEQRAAVTGLKRTPEVVEKLRLAGRGRVGSKSNRSRLTEDRVLEIKGLLWSGLNVPQVAEQVGLACGLVNTISAGYNWTHVPWPIGPRRPAPDGRFPPGQKPSNTKLDETQVLEIRQRYDAGEHYREIASDYSFVTPENVNMICHRKTWKHVI